MIVLHLLIRGALGSRLSKAGGLCLFVSMYLGLLKPFKHSDLYAEDQIGRFYLSAPHRLNIDHHNRATIKLML